MLHVCSSIDVHMCRFRPCKVSTFASEHMTTCMSVCLCVCVFVCVCVCVCVFVCVCLRCFTLHESLSVLCMYLLSHKSALSLFCVYVCAYECVCVCVCVCVCACLCVCVHSRFTPPGSSLLFYIS